jgi:hypothetical protein
MFGKGALLLVIGFSLIFGIVGLRLNRLQSRAVDNMSYYHDVTKSHNLASMGANVAMSKVYQDSSIRGVVTTQSFTSGALKGGSFTARVDSISTIRLRVRSTSSFQGYNDTVEVYLDKSAWQSFSMYAWMTNNENGVYWISKDTVWGRVHSNGTLNISGSPVFMEKVTTSKSISPKPGTGLSNGIYKKGYETGVATITLPSSISEIVTASTNGGKKYTQNIYVTLSAGTTADNNGKAYIRYTQTGSIVDSISLSNTSFNGVIYSTKNVYVQGTLDGQLTIAAQQNLYIIDDVQFERDPLTGASNDLLGLVADQDVIVSNVTATKNLEIDAAIFARAGSFTAEDYDSRSTSSAGTLTLTGGIIQNTRGAVSTFSNGTIQTGYSKRYHYDPRLSDPNVRPPFFPGFFRKTLAIVNWWESVRKPAI